MNHNDVFSSQREALVAAREFFWGTAPSHKRPIQTFSEIKADPKFDTPKGYFAVYVTARVNKRDVVIEFDTFGRPNAITVIKEA